MPARPSFVLPVWAIVERDLRKYFRSPALLLVSLVLPLLQLVVIGYAFGGKITGLSVMLVDLDGGGEAVRIREKLEAVEAGPQTLRLEPGRDLQRALQATRDGRVKATIVIPEGYSRRVGQGNRPQLGLVLDNTDPFVVTTLSQKIGEVVGAVNLGDLPPRLPARVDLGVVELFPYVEYIEYLLPGSITLSIFVCALIGGGLVYIDDKWRGFHEGYLVSPITKLQLLLGLLLAGVIKATLAGVIVSGAGCVIAGVSTPAPVTVAALFVFIVLVSFSFISLISFLMVRVNDPVIPRATFGVMNTLLFFPSGAMYPVESFPPWLQAVSAVNPFTYAVHGLRALLLKGVGPSAILDDFLFLGGFGLTCCLGVLLLFQRRL